VRQTLFPPLRGGALLEAGSAPSCVGMPSPQPWVRSGGRAARLDDITGAHFRVLALPSYSCEQHIGDRSNSLGIRIYRLLQTDGAAQDALVEQDRVFSDWMKTHDVQAILVRPDHLVFAGLNNSSDLERGLDAYEHWTRGKPDRPVS
jgi:hypothetical protein